MSSMFCLFVCLLFNCKCFFHLYVISHVKQNSKHLMMNQMIQSLNLQYIGLLVLL